MTVKFEGASISKGFLTYDGERHDVYGGSAEVFYGGQGDRTTATRVAVGAAVAGPAGALVGAMARKRHTNVYVNVTLADGYSIDIGPSRDEGKAREFASVVDAAAKGRGPEYHR